MRQSAICYGSFKQLFGAAVHANGWWLRVAGGVSLDAEPKWRDLGEFRTVVESIVGEIDPEYGSVRSFIGGAPIALSCSHDSFTEPLAVGLIACRLQNEVDIAYPFLVRQENGSVQCGFSIRGPSQDIQDGILIALGCRLLSSTRTARESERMRGGRAN